MPAALLLLFFALAVGSIKRNGPTFDEQGFLVRGLAYLRGEHRQIRVGHPLGLNALNAALLVNDPAVALPTQDPSWQGTSFHRPAELFLWEIGNRVEHVIWLGRLPTVWLGLLLVAICGRWAWELSGRYRAGLIALALAALDPNLIAHSSLSTTDLGLAAGAAAAGFTLWRFLHRPGWQRAAVAGAAFGLLMNTKYTAALFIPLFGLVILAWLMKRFLTDGKEHGQKEVKKASVFSSVRENIGSPLAQLVLLYPLAAFLTLWACYGFAVGRLPDNLPTFSQFSGSLMPMPAYFEQLFDLGGRLQATTPAFLLGRHSDQGWWYYFPVAFLLKTPLPTLLLLTWAGITWWRKRPVDLIDLTALLIPAAGYFAIALTSNINLGYRHLLPVLPFLFVFIGVTLKDVFRIPYSVFPSRITHHASRITQYTIRNTPLQSLISNLLLLWLALASLLIFPHSLSFFNALAGGPNNGWRALVDSNLDWGQDLPGLKTWMADNGVERVWLSYFGEARPDYYGIPYDGLDSFPPRLMNPQARPFYPHDPAPGYYAVSASNLQGVLFRNHDLFAWFREREPVAKVGYSIFIYEVEPHGEPVELALGGMQVDEIAAADYTLLGTNQVRLRWFDPAQSLLVPHRGQIWLALANDVAVEPDLRPALDTLFSTTKEGDDYTLYQLRPGASQGPVPYTIDSITVFQHGSAEIGLFGNTWPELSERIPDWDAKFITAWLQMGEPQPVKIFIHSIGPDGQIAAQWDGLGAAWEGWRRGDVLIQAHFLTLPPDAASGRYEVRGGLYDPETLTRWQPDSLPFGGQLVP